jgi:hypothetical protein
VLTKRPEVQHKIGDEIIFISHENRIRFFPFGSTSNSDMVMEGPEWTPAPDITTTKDEAEKYAMLVGHWKLDLKVSGSLNFLTCLTVK